MEYDQLLPLGDPQKPLSRFELYGRLKDLRKNYNGDDMIVVRINPKSNLGKRLLELSEKSRCPMTCEECASENKGKQCGDYRNPATKYARAANYATEAIMDWIAFHRG